MDDRIKRITENEARLNRINAWLENITGDAGEDARPLDEIRILPTNKDELKGSEQ